MNEIKKRMLIDGEVFINDEGFIDPVRVSTPRGPYAHINWPFVLDLVAEEFAPIPPQDRADMIDGARMIAGVPGESMLEFFRRAKREGERRRLLREVPEAKQFPPEPGSEWINNNTRDTCTVIRTETNGESKTRTIHIRIATDDRIIETYYQPANFFYNWKPKT